MESRLRSELQAQRSRTSTGTSSRTSTGTSLPSNNLLCHQVIKSD